MHLTNWGGIHGGYIPRLNDSSVKVTARTTWLELEWVDFQEIQDTVNSSQFFGVNR
jgi:hypothetical protein